MGSKRRLCAQRQIVFGRVCGESGGLCDRQPELVRKRFELAHRIGIEVGRDLVPESCAWLWHLVHLNHSLWGTLGSLASRFERVCRNCRHDRVLGLRPAGALRFHIWFARQFQL